MNGIMWHNVNTLDWLQCKIIDFFSNFDCHIIGTLRVKANIIIQSHEMFNRLFNDRKMFDLV